MFIAILIFVIFLFVKSACICIRLMQNWKPCQFSRSLRGHLLTESALMSKIINDFIFDSEALDDSEYPSDDIREIHEIWAGALNGSINIDEALNCKAFIRLEEAIHECKQRLSNSSRTAKLWIQYMEYISILKFFIRAERTADWN